MAKKPKRPVASPPKAATPEDRRHVVQVNLRYIGDTPEEATAWHLTQPTVQAAATMQRIEPSLEVNTLADELAAQVARVNAGDMKRPEAMLYTQAATLNELFNSLARRAQSNIGAGNLPAGETFLRLALKAQSQSRATLETLSVIKNPPVVFAKQANFANGPQQVNNGLPGATAPAHGEKQDSSPNKLLEDSRHEQQWLDTGAAGTTAQGDQVMAPMGQIQRAANTRGQGAQRSQRVERRVASKGAQRSAAHS